MKDNAAAALAPLVGGAEVVNELYGYMSLLGIQGIGLVEATQRAPIVGHIIGERFLLDALRLDLAQRPLQVVPHTVGLHL